MSNFFDIECDEVLLLLLFSISFFAKTFCLDLLSSFLIRLLMSSLVITLCGTFRFAPMTIAACMSVYNNLYNEHK